MKKHEGQTFRQFRLKMFLRTTALLLLSVSAVYGLYSLALRGHLAQWCLSALQGLGMPYPDALALYQRAVRQHMDVIILMAMLLLFLGLMYVYLRWFTGYFRTISRGMDALLEETPGEVTLPPELLSIERQMNTVKQVIQQQRNDLRLAEQQKNDLVMYLAHDLKTPLASAISYLSLLRDQGEISQELREKYLAISLSKTERLEDLINEFLESAKFGLSDVALHYSRIDLTRLLEQLVYEFQPFFAEKGLTCSLTAEETVTLDCDGEKMQRVFENLLRNAVLYSFDGSEICISVQRRREGLTIQFQNQGPTIPKEKLELIFAQFYRLDTGRSTSGTGLGLAIAKQIVTLHKGCITAESRDNVTSFTVTLPGDAGRKS